MSQLARGPIYVPIEQAAVPLTGECIANQFWVVHPDHGLTFYPAGHGPIQTATPAPQCNAVESAAQFLQRKVWPGHKVQLIPVVFLRHAEIAWLNSLRRHKKVA